MKSQKFNLDLYKLYWKYSEYFDPFFEEGILGHRKKKNTNYIVLNKVNLNTHSFFKEKWKAIQKNKNEEEVLLFLQGAHDQVFKFLSALNENVKKWKEIKNKKSIKGNIFQDWCFEHSLVLTKNKKLRKNDPRTDLWLHFDAYEPLNNGKESLIVRLWCSNEVAAEFWRRKLEVKCKSLSDYEVSRIKIKLQNKVEVRKITKVCKEKFSPLFKQINRVIKEK